MNFLFTGSEDPIFLRRAFALTLKPQLEQLKMLTQLPGFEIDVEIDLKVAGDMMWLCKIYGNMGPASLYKCLICTAKDMISTQQLPLRTIETMTANAEDFQAMYDPNRTRQQQLKALSRRCKSIEHAPLLQIQPENIVPASLHCTMGLCYGLMKVLEQYIGKCDVASGRILFTRDCLREEFGNRLKRIGVYSMNWFQTFSGKP